ncbi:hypothetical protein CCP1ISM_140018 [Azospirillaceae bacterium]
MLEYQKAFNFKKFQQAYSFDEVCKILKGIGITVSKNDIYLFRNRGFLNIPVIKSGRGGEIKFPLLAVYELALFMKLALHGGDGEKNGNYKQASITTIGLFWPYFRRKESDYNLIKNKSHEDYSRTANLSKIGIFEFNLIEDQSNDEKTLADRLFNGTITINDPCIIDWSHGKRYIVTMYSHIINIVDELTSINEIFKGKELPLPLVSITLFCISELFMHIDTEIMCTKEEI